MAASIKDVALLARVSSATVSRVLAQKDHIRPKTRQQVLDAVNALGYQPSRVARSLRVRSSQIIGLMISDIQNPFFTSLVRAVEDQASARQYAVILCNSDEDSHKESLYIDLMLAERVGGVIITPTQETESPVKKLVEAGIPVVLVDRRLQDLELDTVILDNVQAARQIVQHLLEQGHRRIGAILGDARITTGRERYLGYAAALQDNGIPLDLSLIRAGLPKESLGYQFTNQLLDLPEPPTALFTGNNLITVGALRAVRERKVRLPQQLSIAAFDDMEWNTLINPQLTAISQPTYEMGRTAADLILRRISNPQSPVQQIVFEPELRVRESTAYPVVFERRQNGVSL